MKKVLIIDDIPHFRSALKLNLENQGYTVDDCNFPKIGVDKVKECKDYDIIFIDFQYDNDKSMTGTDVGMQIRRLSPLASLILCTAYGKDKIEEYIHVGFDNYFDKNIVTKEYDAYLTERIKKACENSQKRIKSIFTPDELEPVRQRMQYLKQAYEELKFFSQRNIAKKINEYMQRDGVIKIPNNYNAHLGYFRLRNAKGEYEEKALKVRQILKDDDFSYWNDLVKHYNNLKKIVKEFDIEPSTKSKLT